MTAICFDDRTSQESSLVDLVNDKHWGQFQWWNLWVRSIVSVQEVSSYHAPNVCAPHKFIYWSSVLFPTTKQYGSFEIKNIIKLKRSRMGTWSCGISVRRDTKGLCVLRSGPRTQSGQAACGPRKAPSPGPLTFLAPWSATASLYLNHSVDGILLWKPNRKTFGKGATWFLVLARPVNCVNWSQSVGFRISQ